MGDWINWSGGECPLKPGTPLWVRHRDRTEFKTVAMGDYNYRWGHENDESDIIAYRLVKPADAPVTGGDQAFWDRAAIAAMQGLIQHHAWNYDSTAVSKKVAELSRECADALAAERAKRMKGEV